MRISCCRAFGACVLLLCLALVKPLWAVDATSPPSAELVAQFLAAREALVRDPKINVPELSKIVGGAVREAGALIDKKDYDGALSQLRRLETYRPLRDFPSFEVQLALLAVYHNLGDTAQAAAHAARARAMREILWYRIGSGNSTEDPARVIMVNEITEWMRSRRLRLTELRSLPHRGRELLEAHYTGAAAPDPPKIAYFEMDARVRAAEKIRLFDPLPISGFNPRQLAALKEAREKRQRFLEDRSFAYDELLYSVRSSMKVAAELDGSGRTAQALAELKKIEAIRPLEDVPFVNLLGMYSYLSGKVGDVDRQRELRQLIFGINQAIAHSGDGLSFETAVDVISVDEEYAWLRDKGLTPAGQRLVETPRGMFDVLAARDAAGNQRDYYFNITRFYPRSIESAKRAQPKP